MSADGDGELARDLTIVNKKGLHARASAKFVQLVERFDAEVTVSKDGQSVSGTSIMGLMMLAAGIGSQVHVTASGRDAVAAMAAITDLDRRAIRRGRLTDPRTCGHHAGARRFPLSRPCRGTFSRKGRRHDTSIRAPSIQAALLPSPLAGEGAPKAG